ncbi:MAG: aldo/keto reductase [Betaproteobacteria bacterium]|nr:aldo/keto reductase [Betaproteobacteria bacterium]
MLQRPIPSSGERIPVVGLGTYQAFDAGASSAEQAPLVEVLRTLVARGGSVIDSSPMYGRAETAVGEVATAAGVANQLFYATKVWTSGKEAGIAQMEESFRRMRVSRMDLMQIHNLVDWRTHTATLKDWKAKGSVRYVGITHYHEGAYDDLEKLLKTKAYDFVQLNYSIAEREAEERVLPLARELGVAVIANRPFAQANLFRRVKGKDIPAWTAEFDCTSWAQFFLKYILAHPALTCVIPATSKPVHAKDNLEAGYGKLPDAHQRQAMVKLVDSL